MHVAQADGVARLTVIEAAGDFCVLIAMFLGTPPQSVRHFVHAGAIGIGSAGVAACTGALIRRTPLEEIGAALGVHPDDGILWAMLLRLLFGPEAD